MDFVVEVLLDVEVDKLPDTLMLTDDDILVEKLELNDFEVEVLVDFEVDTLFEVLVLTDVDTLELSEVEVEVLVLALEYVE